MPKYTLRPRLGTLDVRYADGAVDRVPWTMLAMQGLFLRRSAAAEAVFPRLPRSIGFNSARQGNTARQLWLRSVGRALKEGRFSDYWLAPSAMPQVFVVVMMLLGLGALLAVAIPRGFAGRLAVDDRLRLFLPQHYDLLCYGIAGLGGLALALYVAAPLSIMWPPLRQRLRRPRPLAFGIGAAGLRVDFDDGTARDFPWDGVRFISRGLRFGDSSKTTFLFWDEGLGRLRLLKHIFGPRASPRDESWREIAPALKWFFGGWLFGLAALTGAHLEVQPFGKPLWFVLLGWTGVMVALPTILTLGPAFETWRRWKSRPRL